MTSQPFTRALAIGATLGCLSLAACATPKTRIVVQRVSVPVSVPCRVALPDRSPYAADTVPLDATLYEKAQALLVDREQRKAREAELEAAAKSCS